MTRPLIQIHDASTGEDVIREMNDAEFAEWQNRVVPSEPAQTKEQLMAELAALTAKIHALPN